MLHNVCTLYNTYKSFIKKIKYLLETPKTFFLNNQENKERICVIKNLNLQPTCSLNFRFGKGLATQPLAFDLQLKN